MTLCHKGIRVRHRSRTPPWPADQAARAQAHDAWGCSEFHPCGRPNTPDGDLRGPRTRKRGCRLLVPGWPCGPPVIHPRRGAGYSPGGGRHALDRTTQCMVPTRLLQSPEATRERTSSAIFLMADSAAGLRWGNDFEEALPGRNRNSDSSGWRRTSQVRRSGSSPCSTQASAHPPRLGHEPSRGQTCPSPPPCCQSFGTRDRP